VIILIMALLFVVLFGCVMGMAYCIDKETSQADYRRAIAEDYVRGLNNDR
jgi:hypothetical protein